jgi:hypothetical protein
MPRKKSIPCAKVGGEAAEGMALELFAENRYRIHEYREYLQGIGNAKAKSLWHAYMT